MRYRPDIDGLRAIAVAVVVAFHAGFQSFAGGFVGVDVFFVISGYLITGLLLEELEKSGSIDLKQFYTRRVRRLLPALALVVLVTLAAGWVLLTPVGGEQQGLAKSALALAGFSSNIYFWLSQDYFSGSSDLLPLLHTWSLAVEEQYYLLWPPLLWALVALGRRTGFSRRACLAGGLVAIFVSSLALCLWLTTEAPGAAFYLTPARAWEFAAGGLLVFAGPQLQRLRPAHSALLALAGLAAIAAAVLWFDHATRFPGIAALAPVGGTLALIAAGCAQHPGAPLRWLSARPIVAIGLASYSWYLWHWPLLALARAYSLGERDLLRDGVLSLAALGLAALTYRFVETPIRQGRPFPFAAARQTLFAGGAMLASIAAAGVALGLAARLLERDAWTHRLAAAYYDRAPSSDRCLGAQTNRFGGLAEGQECIAGSRERVQVVVWGDSHADHFFPLVGESARARGVGARELTRASCPPLLGVAPYAHGIANEECARFNEAAIAEIERLALHGLRGVFIAGRWPAYLGEGLPEAPSEPGAQLSIDGVPLDAAASRVALDLGLRAALERLRRSGLHVVIAVTAPEMHHPAPACLARRTLEECAMPRAEVERRRQHSMAVLRAAAQEIPGVHLYDPLDQFCDRDRCYPLRANVVMYTDAHHLSAAGAVSLRPSLAEEMAWLTAPGGGLQAALRHENIYIGDSARTAPYFR